jgi:hypothetical protein
MKIPAQTALHPAEISRTLRRMMVPVTMTIEEVMTPGNWANVFSKVHRDDEVIVWREDRAFRLHLLVVEVGTGYVRTVILHKLGEDVETVADDGEALEVPAGYRVNHAPKHKWRVLMDGFGDPISKDHNSRAEAARAAIAHAAKANAVAA